MRMRIALVALLVASGLGGALAGEQSEARQERFKELERLLAEATNSFHTGRWVDAKARLDKIVAMQPAEGADDAARRQWYEDIHRLRELFGDRALTQMALAVQEGRDFGRGPQVLLGAAREYEILRLADPRNIQNTVAEVIGDPLNRRAMHDLTVMGAFAAPELLRQMRDAVEDDQRVTAELLLARLGPPMTVPMAVALDGFNDRETWRDDEIGLVIRLSRVLGDILPRDARALPALARLAGNDARPAVARQAARAAFDKVAGDRFGGDPASAAELYYAEAERLHLDGPEVRREVDRLQGLYFAWDAVADDGRGALVSTTAPAFALNDLYAQSLAVTGMRLHPENAAAAGEFQALLARVWTDQAAEIEELASVARRREATRAYDDYSAAEVEVWARRLESLRRRALGVGVRGLARGLEEALPAGKTPVTVGLLDALAATARWADVEELGLDVNPLLAALRHADARVRRRAAVALVRVGLPAGHPDHPAVVPPLVDGAQIKTPKVVLLIGSDAERRAQVASRLEARGVTVLAAASGQEGLALARQYPLKDAILLDSEMREFALLRQRLDALPLVAGSELPLVIVTNGERAARIEDAFRNDPVWSILPKQANVGMDTGGLYERLVKLRQDNARVADAGARGVVVLVNDNPDERRDLVRHLRLMAERERRSESAPGGELIELLSDRRLRGDAAELRTLFSNVFLDDELSGMNAMATLEGLRRLPLARTTPVALLTGAQGRAEVETLFKEFLDPADCRLLDYNADEATLADAVDEMSETNPLVKIDHQKQYFRLAALLCARALGDYALAGGQALDAAQSEGLRAAMTDAARPVDVRIAIARALGHWADALSAGSLAATYRNPENARDLRYAALVALGDADRAGTQHAEKLAALTEEANDVALRDAAGVALAKEDADSVARIPAVMALWHNAPMQVVRMDKSAAASAPDVAGEVEDTADAGGEDW